MTTLTPRTGLLVALLGLPLPAQAQERPATFSIRGGWDVIANESSGLEEDGAAAGAALLLPVDAGWDLGGAVGLKFGKESVGTFDLGSNGDIDRPFEIELVTLTFEARRWLSGRPVTAGPKPFVTGRVGFARRNDAGDSGNGGLAGVEAGMALALGGGVFVMGSVLSDVFLLASGSRHSDDFGSRAAFRLGFGFLH